MLVRKIKYPIHYLGRGRRIGIWVNGCLHHCHNCIAENLWPFDEKYHMSIDAFFEELNKYEGKPGLTFTGGEPFLHKDFLAILKRLKEENYHDILVYTGFTLEEITKDKKMKQFLNYIDVLIEGRYIDDLNDNLPLRGSSNQRIVILNPLYEEEYQQLLKGKRNYEIEYDGTTLNIYGVVPKGFLDLIKKEKK